MAGGVTEGNAVGRGMAVGSALPILQPDIKTAIMVRMGNIFFIETPLFDISSICIRKISLIPQRLCNQTHLSYIFVNCLDGNSVPS
jgi:hypothetical protein